MSLNRRLPALLLAVGVVLFVVGLVLGLRPITVELVSVDGRGADSSFACGTHFAPVEQPFEVRPNSNMVQIGPDANIAASGVERFCSDAISRAWVFLPWLTSGLGVVTSLAGLVLLSRRQGAARPAAG